MGKKGMTENTKEDDLMTGYLDGLDPDSPEASDNRSPAYIHGFLNGREDAGIKARPETAQQRRDLLAAIS